MSTLKATYDIFTETFSVEEIDLSPYYVDVVAAIDLPDGYSIPLINFSFGCTVTDVNGVIYEDIWPKGSVYTSTDQKVLFSTRVNWLWTGAVRIRVWFENYGTLHEDTWGVTVPELDKPYPSWLKGPTGWVAPKPNPSADGIFYQWSEADLDWIPEVV